MATTATTKAPRKGKGSAILARVNADVREAIDAEVARTGTSISMVVDMWLRDALRVQPLLGTLPIPVIVLEIASAASAIENMGVPVRSERGYNLLSAVIDKLLIDPPTPFPTNTYFDHVVAQNRGDPAAIAAAKAADEAYEADQDLRATLIRKQLGLPQAEPGGGGGQR